ncbi:lipopolysaccharide biosynthesis protein [Acinetobacter sp. YH12201]|uniref:lipopolysaccharide biosynthesis protein n=1 Tax=Acinetobacter sp. YH12201 TaxID=2601140 RepID=UPI0015D2D769|nr:lipopolysaccharide biosynthesis protein [Acinetobacter sp. YH12201]
MSLKAKTVSGVFWTILQRFSVQFINLFVQIILARLLMPEDFGLIAMIQIIITLGQTLIDSGMASSLIRTHEPDERDYSTVFFTNLGVSVIIYGLAFLIAPYFAHFFEMPVLIDLVRVYAITFIIQAFAIVQLARLTKQMNFKLQMLLQLPATFLGGICGVLMAYYGYGVWSLVGLNIVMATILAISLWIKTDWRPRFIFDWSRFKVHFNFGYKLTLSSLLANLYTESYSLIIGKMFSSTQLGLYKQANTLRMFPVTNVTSALQKVTYPLFSQVQDDNPRLKRIFKKITFLVFFTTTPLMLLSIVIAEPLFRILLTEKWTPAVPYFQILCIAAIFYPLSMYNLNIIAAKGLSGLHLKLEVIKKTLSIIVLVALLPFGMYGVVIAAGLGMIIHALVNCIYSGRLIDYSIFEQMKNLYPIVLIGVLTMIIVYYFLIYMGDNTRLTDFLLLVLSTILYIIIYTIFSFVFKVNGIHEIYELLKSLKKSVRA